MDNGLPVTVTVSIALHAGAIGGWLYLHQITKKTPMRMISNVELLVPVKSATPMPSPRTPTPPSTWNFLKMALPTVQRAPLQIKAPDIQRDRKIEMPKALDEKMGRLSKAQLAALDLERKRPSMAALDPMKLDTSRRRSAALDNMPKLEEIGTRRAPKAAIAMAALAEERRGRLQAQGIDSEPLADRRRSQPVQAALPEEAQGGGKLSKMAEMLTSEPIALSGRTRAQSVPGLDTMALPEPTRKETRAAAEDIKRKSLEIEGPLSNRKLVSYSVPEFPSWAVERGLRQAEVRIRFYVNAAGNVLTDGMRVEATSGHGRLDRLAMDALKTWRFQKQAGAGSQWGIITFRFELE